MGTEITGIIAFKADEQALVFIDSSESAFSTESPFVNFFIQQSLTPALDSFPVSFILRYVGD